MGKAKLKSTKPQTVEAEISPDTPAPASEPDFSNGELGQLQEILYGAQQRATNEQIVRLQTQINEQIQTMSNMLNSRLNQLTDSFEKTTKAFEVKLDELQTQQHNTAESMSKAMADKNQQIESSISLLSKNTGEEAARVHSELKNVETQLQSQLRETHDSLQLKMNTSVDQLQNKKLDTHNLAQILGRVSEQLATTHSAATK